MSSNNSVGGWGWGWLGQDGGGVAGNPLLILDQFTDADSTSLDAHTIAPTNVPAASWTENQGDWDIQSNQAGNTGADPGGLRWIATADAGTANATITCSVIPQNAGAIPAIIGRFADVNNFWGVYLTVGDDTYSIVEITGGGDTVRATTAVVLTSGTPYLVRVAFSGTSIIATIDGANQISHTSSSHQTNTKFGICERSTTASRFDNFQVDTA